MTFGRHRNDFCCGLADVKVRDEFRAKFKIPHSYDHLVSTSGQCDVSMTGLNRLDWEHIPAPGKNFLEESSRVPSWGLSYSMFL